MDDVFGHLDSRFERIWADGTSGRIARRWSATDDWLPPQWFDFSAENRDRLSNGLSLVSGRASPPIFAASVRIAPS
jgi:hypothetical protein